MNTTIFEVDKEVHYSDMHKEYEIYTIIMNSKDIMSCCRDSLIELQQLITLALNDQKEEPK